MRTVKFRAWDKTNKCWYEPIYEAYKGNLWELMVSFSGDLLAHTIENGEEGIYHESMFPNRYEVMQSTGLHDKNGLIELYEGDIIDVKGNKKGNIYENKQEETDLVIQGFGTANWEATNKEAMARGCKYA